MCHRRVFGIWISGFPARKRIVSLSRDSKYILAAVGPFLYSRRDVAANLRDVAANLRRGGAVGVEDLCGYLLESMIRPIMWVRAWIHRDLGPRMGRRREWFHVIPRWIHGSRRTWRGGRNSKTERGIISGQSNTILIWIPDPRFLSLLLIQPSCMTAWQW